MNKLKNESSHYLLQHANNPVDWYPWGEEAFEKAREEGKAILVSIGYSTCHWCHVMAHESFEDAETAKLMNNLFINIKVDREERPDIDAMYMDAVQAMTGSGGWPLNVFITPDKKPFYGGTYYPPKQAYNRPSWKELLINLHQVYTQRPDEIEKQTEQMMAHLQQITKVGHTQGAAHSFDHWETLGYKLMKTADRVEGGFGGAPKFPSTFVIGFLLDAYVLHQDEAALTQALLSLDKMALGGIYDQLGGGFARYSTDAQWFAPHFEKMLYDNALLLEVYAKAYAITQDYFYKAVIDETVGWLQREMLDESGGFYAAQDADSEGVEGKYYTWDKKEIDQLLEKDAADFCSMYNVSEDGNWLEVHTQSRTNILNRNDKKEPSDTMNHARERLLARRDKRIKPLTDDKIVLAWNALMNKALSICALYTANDHYLFLAEKNMHFLLQHFQKEDALYYHVGREGVRKQNAFADDLFYLCDALVVLSQVTAKTKYLLEANKIMNYCQRYFRQEEDLLFSFSEVDDKDVPINKKEILDGAMPSPNAVACSVLFYLAYAFGNPNWQKQAEGMLSYMQPYYLKHPSSFALWASLEQRQYHEQKKEVTIVGAEAHKIYGELYTKQYLANVMNIVALGVEESIVSTAGKLREGKTQIFVCTNQSCLPPTTDIKEAKKLIFPS